MKKKIIIMAFLAISSMAIGQTVMERRIEHFVTSAKSEFNLDKKKEKELFQKRTSYISEMQETFKAQKNGEITVDEQKERNAISNNSFRKFFIELSGKTAPEVNDFFMKVSTELKDIY